MGNYSLMRIGIWSLIMRRMMLNFDGVIRFMPRVLEKKNTNDP